ncbi:MAG TPA: hypothetical protein EYM69_03740 [Dehalococcoidia bacterium]|nr:hypothetical protein [Dehalococcoidia bacterium]
MLGAVIYHVKKYLLADAFIAAAIRKSALKYAVYIFIGLEGLNAQIDPLVDRVGQDLQAAHARKILRRELPERWSYSIGAEVPSGEVAFDHIENVFVHFTLVVVKADYRI